VSGPADAYTDAPVDCSSSKENISMLKNDKESASDTNVIGIPASTPIGLVEYMLNKYRGQTTVSVM
jgi:hypothetical protein